MQRGTTAILPVKRFSLAKSRLRGAASGAAGRALLAAAMFTDVLDALAWTPGIGAIVVVTADPMRRRWHGKREPPSCPTERSPRIPGLPNWEFAGRWTTARAAS
jgi:hypothetical protein